MSFLTIFTSPKPFTHSPHIDMIQRNTVQAMMKLGPEVDALLIGDEEGMAEASRQLGIRHISNVRRNQYGTPLVSSIFEQARQNSASPFLACINADNLVMPDFVEAVKQVASQEPRFILVGQRWDVDILEPIDFSQGWDERLRQDILKRGVLRTPGCSDFFVFPRDFYADIHPFALGRSGWDNWMIYWARRQGWKVIDVTASVMVGHQNHDYSHLPKNEPPYRLPESQENIRMGGGRRTIFSILDATHRLVNGRIEPIPLSWKRFWRELEIFPLIKLRRFPALAFFLANLSFAILHPKQALGEWRPYLAKVKRRLLGKV